MKWFLHIVQVGTFLIGNHLNNSTPAVLLTLLKKSEFVEIFVDRDISVGGRHEGLRTNLKLYFYSKIFLDSFQKFIPLTFAK